MSKGSNMTDESGRLNTPSNFNGFPYKRKLVAPDCYQLLFDFKIGKNVSIMQSATRKCTDLSDLNTSTIRKIESNASCVGTIDGESVQRSQKKDLETTLMESFVLRQQLHETTNKIIVQTETAESTRTNAWSVTPKNNFCKDIDCTQDVTKSELSSITPGKLIEYNPSKKIGGFSESKMLWENPVFGVDIQDLLPSVANKRVLRHSNFDKIYNSVSFTKDALKDIQLIGQVEKQFIACVLDDSTKQNVLVLIDQHAAHERIRLEKLLQQIGYYETKTSATVLKHGVCRLVPPAEVLFYENEIDLLLHYTKEFNEVGLRFSVLRKKQSTAYRKVFISSIPSVFVNVCRQQLEAKGSHVNESVIKEFVLEQAKLLRCGVGKCNLSSPTIFKVLASYACHGAIKFGDALTKENCIELVKQLSKCQLPFQCAHGRPSIIPLLSLDVISSIQTKTTRTKPKLSSLRNKICNIATE